jgi:hypothetical protein
VTLLFSAHDTLHNGAVVLRDYLTERASHARSPRRPRRTSPRKERHDTSRSRAG